MMLLTAYNTSVASNRKIAILVLVVIMFFGGWLRFQGLNWDQGYHLQPDERYISLVVTTLKPPASWQEYIDPNLSSLSPYIHGYGAYIYGQLPLTALTYLSNWLGMDGYDKTYLLGRMASAFLDTLSIMLVYKLGKRLWNEKTGIIGAGFYAFSPLAIQYSHFMTMESWVTFFWLLLILRLTEVCETLSTSVKFRKLHTIHKIMLVGVLLGAAMAVKASSVVLAPVVVGWIVIGEWRKSGKLEILGKFGILGELGIILVMAGLSFRLFQPTIFRSASWLDWSLRQDFYQAFNFQRLAIEGKAMFPPQWQWVGTARWWFPLKNIVLWGMGPAAGGLAVVGVIWQICQIWRIRHIGGQDVQRKAWRLLLAVWAAGIFIWQGGQFVKNMRYFMPFFPLYALFAANLIRSLIRSLLAVRQGDSWLGKLILTTVLLLSGIWAVMFTGIYRRPTTRVLASEWIYQNIPPGSKIMLEEWDDPLPLLMPGYEMFSYQTEMVGVYATDDEKKKEQINRWTTDFDWIVLSSPRAKGSIGRLPKEFPQMSKFYRDLDSGSLGFAKTAEFASYPSLKIENWKLKIEDSSAEESFWVYDHPKVEIYKKIQNSKFKT